LGIYPKEYKPTYCTDTCTPMFIVALFIVAKLWRQLHCPIIDEWIKKMGCMYIMEYYSTIKKNEILSYEEKRIELEITMLSKIEPSSERQISCIFFPHMWNLDLIIIVIIIITIIYDHKRGG
jgi:hypothetical protein